QAYAVQGFQGLFLVRHAVKVLRQHYVFERREIGDEMKLLEDEADLFRTKTVQLGRRHFRDIATVDPDFPAGRLVETPDQVHQRGLPRAGRPHDGQPLAGRHGEGDIVKRAYLQIALVHARDVLHLNRHYSPRRIPAGWIRCSMRSGAVEASRASIALPSSTGNRRPPCGRMAASKFALPIQKAVPLPTTNPAAAPASASRAASAAKSKFTVLLDAPRAFITAKSLRRSRTELVNVTIMHSRIRVTITVDAARTTARVLSTTAVCVCVIWRMGLTSKTGREERSALIAASISWGRPSTRTSAVLGSIPVSSVNCFRSR